VSLQVGRRRTFSSMLAPRAGSCWHSFATCRVDGPKCACKIARTPCRPRLQVPAPWLVVFSLLQPAALFKVPNSMAVAALLAHPAGRPVAPTKSLPRLDPQPQASQQPGLLASRGAAAAAAAPDAAGTPATTTLRMPRMSSLAGSVLRLGSWAKHQQQERAAQPASEQAARLLALASREDLQVGG